MATVTEKQYTPEDLLHISDRPMPELVDGELVERVLMGEKADAVAVNIGYFLKGYSLTTLAGLINGAHGSYQIFPNEPNKVRIPDVSFTKKDRLPAGAAEGHSPIAPDLVVEVISPNDLAADLLAKIEDYQAAGIPLIWVVDPEIRSVRAFRLTGTEPALHEGDILRGGDVLPGFVCPVSAFFEGI